MHKFIMKCKNSKCIDISEYFVSVNTNTILIDTWKKLCFGNFVLFPFFQVSIAFWIFYFKFLFIVIPVYYFKILHFLLFIVKMS